MPFEFIDNAKINRSARKKIRAHVMLKKNLGKTRPPRRKAAKLQVKTLMPTRTTVVVANTENLLPPPFQALGSEFSIYPFPAKLTTRSRGLVCKFISGVGELVNQANLCCQLVDVTTSIWIRYIFSDEAYFHSAVALSILFNDSKLAKCEDDEESLQHLSHAIQSINERLSGALALSDTTIAAIISLIGYERLRGQQRNGMIHFMGLQRIIELRGGVSGIMSNPHLVSKLFRSDLELALYYGAPTNFCIEDVPRDGLTQILRTYRKHLDKQIWNFHFVSQLSSELLDVFLDVLALAYLLNNHEMLDIKMTEYSFQDAAIRILYRLIQIRPLSSERTVSDLENTIHLTLTAFITPLFLTSSTAPLLPGLLREAVRHHSANDLESRNVLIWVLFIGRSSSIFTNIDESWLIPAIAKLCLDLDLCTWVDIHGVLTQFPWINLAHDKAGQELWKQVDQYGENQY